MLYWVPDIDCRSPRMTGHWLALRTRVSAWKPSWPVYKPVARVELIDNRVGPFINRLARL